MQIDALLETLKKRSKAAGNFGAMKSIETWQRFLAMLARGERMLPDALLDTLSQQTHISKDNLRSGLQISLAGLAQPTSKSLPYCAPANKKPFVAILAAGNVPGVALAPAILLSAAGCPVFIKQSKSEQAFMPWLLQEFKAAHPSIPELIYADYWEAEGEPLNSLLSKADKILAYGSNQTIEKLQKNYPGKVIGFGHKISFAYIDHAEYRDGVGKKLALDVALFNQQGCLSVHSIFIKGSKKQAEKWAEQFAKALLACIESLGTDRNNKRPGMRLHESIEAMQLQDIPYFRCGAGLACVAIPPEFRYDFLIGNCFVQVIPVRNEADVVAQLEPFHEYLQGIAIATKRPDFQRLEELFKQAGFSYICSPGKLQAAPLDWANGGVDLPGAVLGNL